MKASGGYRNLAERVRAKARTVDSRNVAAEWNQLADCYALLAERNENADQVAPGDKERPHN